MNKTASLTPATLKIILDKSTEAPFSGAYCEPIAKGSYLCRQCGIALFHAAQQFASSCGWPSFDAEIPGRILSLPDSDGMRTEILCARCGAHLGHVFTGEVLTKNNLRHCVNSKSLDYVEQENVDDTEEAIFAGGCFWGIDYLFTQLSGILSVEVGYIGGKLSDPTYEAVCTQQTGHIEAVRVLYDPTKINYQAVVKFFFEIHDPQDQFGQGPDRGPQYVSRIYYYDAAQQKIANAVRDLLIEKIGPIATEILPTTTFWPAEDYHQHYYLKNGKQPYCHFYQKKF